MGKDSKRFDYLGSKDTKHDEITKELRTQSRELREIRKALKELLDILKTLELQKHTSELPAWAKIEAIPDVIIEDEFVDIRDMGITT